MPTPELLALSSRLSIGAAQVFRNLTVLPLIDGTAPPTGWLTLDQAIGRGVAEISEVSEHGSVPQLRLRNRASEPLFLLDGEELVGAKQNRILNLSILAPAGSGLEIPVSCVEQGRWSWRSRQFQGTERVIYSKLRRSNSEAVDGRDRPPHDPAPAGTEAAVRTALEGAGRLSPSRTRAVGEGEDLRLRGDGLVGAALIAGGGVAHLSLWSADYR